VQQPGLLLIPPVNSRCPLLGRGPLSEQAPRHLAGGAAPPEIVEGDVIAAAGQDVDRIGQAFDDQVWQRDHFASWVTWNFLRGTVEVRRQVKLLANNKQILGRPKGSKTRTIPLAASVRYLLAAYLAAGPARNVTLPWGDLDGKPTTVALILTTRERTALNRNYFNTYVWKPALRKASVEDSRENGTHALRHHYACASRRGREHQGSERVPGSRRCRIHAPDIHPPHAVERRADHARGRRRIRLLHGGYIDPRN